MEDNLLDETNEIQCPYHVASIIYHMWPSTTGTLTGTPARAGDEEIFMNE